MKKTILFCITMAVGWNVQATINETKYTVGNLSSTTLAVTQSVSVAEGDVVVMVAATNKKKSAAPVALTTSAADSLTALSAAGVLVSDPYPNSYIGYVTITSGFGGTYDFIASYPGVVGITANIWLYRLSASSGSIIHLDEAAVEFDSDANITLPLNYVWDGTNYSDIAVVEVASARVGTLTNPATGASGQRVLSYEAMSGTSAARTWNFTYDPANLGKNTGSIMGVVFAEGIVLPQPPSFNSNPVIKSIAITNQPYSGTLADNASDPNGDPMTFLKDGGPVWLNIATNGELSGTPLSGDLGTNQWPILVTDGISGTNSAALKIEVISGNPPPQTSQTNIVLIVIDDLGWMDLSIHGSEFYETPRIDSLATNGMRFTQGYAAHPRCLPSRYGLMTGRFPGASAVPADAPDLIDEEVTIGEALQPAGYETFFAGKWHISHETYLLPQNQGFDINITGGAPGSPPSYFYPYGSQPSDETDKNGLFLENATPVGGMVTDRITGKSYQRTFNAGESGEYITDRLTDEALDWMEWNADKPMFLYMSHYGVHTPYEAPEDLVAKYEAKLTTMDYGDLPEYINVGVGQQKMRQDHPTYAAMIESVDTNVGRLIDKVEELGITGNTIFIFTSDNGGLSNRGGNNTRELATANYPLRTGKGWLYEGGIREAFIVKGPGVTPMVNSNAVVNGTDIYPTILDLTGTALRPDDHRNGVSFKSALNGSAYDRGASILWHSPKARPYSTGDFNSSALRDGDYKLIWWYDTPGRDGEFHYELYNVKTDPGENNDLSLILPAKAADLLAQIKSWHNHEHWERPGAGVSQEPDINDVSKPPQAWLDDPSAPLSLNPNAGNSDLWWGDYLGFDYDLYSKTNLLDATWNVEASGTTSTNATLPIGGDEGFYKIELLLQPER